MGSVSNDATNLSDDDNAIQPVSNADGWTNGWVWRRYDLNGHADDDEPDAAAAAAELKHVEQRDRHQWNECYDVINVKPTRF